MTTWVQENAEAVSRRLRDVDFYISLARVAIHGKRYQLAWRHVGNAIAAKLAAIESFPAAESETDDLGVDFKDLYELAFTKDLLAWSACSHAIANLRDGPWNPVLVGLNALPPLIESLVERFEHMCDRHWPPPSPCAESCNKMVDILRDLIKSLKADAHDANQICDLKEALLNNQKDWFNCLYPDSKVNMWDAFYELYGMDILLMDVYDSLKYQQPIFPSTEFRHDVVLKYLDWVEERKHRIISMVTEVFPGIDEELWTPDWQPAPDRLKPWPPPDHG